MTQTCEPIPDRIAQDILLGLVDAICDRPGETPARRDNRSTEVVHSVLAFQPRDAVEMMFAGMVVTHYHLITHTAHEVFAVRRDDPRGPSNSGIVALDRALVGFVKELRTAQIRPVEGAIAAVEPATRPASAVAVQSQPAPPVRHPEPEAKPSLPPLPARPDGGPTASPLSLPKGYDRPKGYDGASTAAMMAMVSPPMKPNVIGGPAKGARAPTAQTVGAPGNGSARSLNTPATGHVLPGLPGGAKMSRSATG